MHIGKVVFVVATLLVATSIEYAQACNKSDKDLFRRTLNRGIVHKTVRAPAGMVSAIYVNPIWHNMTLEEKIGLVRLAGCYLEGSEASSISVHDSRDGKRLALWVQNDLIFCKGGFLSAC